MSSNKPVGPSLGIGWAPGVVVMQVSEEGEDDVTVELSVESAEAALQNLQNAISRAKGS